MLRTAADACTPRGSASCADPRGVLLPFLKASRFKELYVLRHERTLQLHESLLPHTASIRATVLRRLIDCGLQLQHVAAGIESCSGDWKRPILRFSFCKGVHILFVKHLSNVTECVCSCHRLKFGPLGEPLLLIGEHQNPRKIVFWGIKSRKIFWPAGAGLSPLRRLKAGEAKFSL